MTVYKNHRAEPYFSQVREGKKVVEIRLQKGKYADIKPVDQVNVFTNDEKENFWVEVVDARKYGSLAEMFKHENLSDLLPDAESVEEGVQMVREFYGKEDEKKYGVVAIEVEVK